MRGGNSRGFGLLATPDDQLRAFREDVVAGLSSAIPSIPARWLYDQRGSELFDDITRLPGYYPTRVETALLEAIRGELRSAIPSGSAVVEFVPLDEATRDRVLDLAHRAKR